MIAYAYVRQDDLSIQELRPNQPISTMTAQFSWDTFMEWNEAIRLSHGIHPIIEPYVPEGKSATDSKLQIVDGLIRRSYTLIDEVVQPEATT